MTKTFRRALACLLAVLMVAFSMPFTALAAQANREWWTDDGVDPSTITEEPRYVGYNDDRQEMGSWEFGFAQAIEMGTAEAEEQGWEDHRDDYKPIIAVIVSSQGDASITKANYAQYWNNYYGADTAHTYDAVKTAGNILNPADLKAGQRIAVTVEFGGFDLICNGQFQGDFDTNYLKPAYYPSQPFAGRNGKDTWVAAAGKGSSAVIANGGTMGSAAYGRALTFMGQSLDADNGVWAGTVFGSNFAAGDLRKSNFIGTNTVNATGSRDFGKYGITSFTYSFEVLQDCDLSKVFTFRQGADGTSFEPYSRDSVAAMEGRPDSDKNNGLYLVTMNDTDLTFAKFAPVIWDSYEGGTIDTPHVHDYTETTIPATCTENEKVVKTCSNADGKCDAVTVTEEKANTALGHDFNGKVTANAADKQHTVQCTRCDATTLVDCTYVGTPTGATCTEGGSIVYTCACGDSYTEANGAALGHDLTSNTVTTPATCTEDGSEVTTTTCSRCDYNDVQTKVLTKLGHDYKTDVVTTPATCTEDGSKVTTTTCSRCDYKDVQTEVLTKLGHDYKTDVVTVDATYDADGSVTTTTTCSRCDYHNEDVQVLPMLIGVQVTVTPSALGTATVKGLAVEDEAVTANCEPNKDVTLTAKANNGAVFAGWTVDGKLVATEETITVKAIADITYAPVFQAASEKFTVVFADRYGNVFATQEVASGAEVDFDAVKAPTIVGYTFKGWSMTADEITGPVTIQAVYEKNADAGYTVTAEGCTITVDGAVVSGEGLAYDTLVTVAADDATAWKLGSAEGPTVAYGPSYTFYVGSDVIVVPVKDAVTATPTVAAVSVTKVTDGAKVKASFLATRSMTDDCTFVSAGFVYGKNLADDNITLDDVKAGSGVKAYYCATDAEQFALTYSLAAQQGKMTARAFLAYEKNGEVKVIYAEPQTADYADLLK